MSPMSNSLRCSILFLLCPSLALAACVVTAEPTTTTSSQSNTSVDATGEGGSSGDGDGDGDPGTGDGDGDGDPTTGDGDPISTCLQGCVDVSDCATVSEAFDEDNYACEDGACVYTGCNSDQECESIGNYVCRDFEGTVPYCVQACANVSDCDLGSLAYDEDNYVCEDGGCKYAGCNIDQECDQLPDLVCADIGGALDVCVESCQVPADCGSGDGPFDEDNYDCIDGTCRYTGCNSDEECLVLGAGFVCG